MFQHTKEGQSRKHLSDKLLGYIQCLGYHSSAFWNAIDFSHLLLFSDDSSYQQVRWSEDCIRTRGQQWRRKQTQLNVRSIKQSLYSVLTLPSPPPATPTLFISETAFSYTCQSSPKGDQHPFSPDHISDKNKIHHQQSFVLIYHQILRT